MTAERPGKRIGSWNLPGRSSSVSSPSWSSSPVGRDLAAAQQPDDRSLTSLDAEADLATYKSVVPPWPADGPGFVGGPCLTAEVATTQYYTATSIDGFIADPDGSLDWLFQADSGPGNEDRFSGFFSHVGAMAMGATT